MRLLRPAIPDSVKCRVALRQLGEMWPDAVMAAAKDAGRIGKLAVELHARLAELLNCPPADLRLDHNPALGMRDKVFVKGVHVGYKPHANDPEHLVYRTHQDHLIKTNVRGDGALHPDRVYIKRAKRLERAAANPEKFVRSKQKLRSASRWSKGQKIPSRPFPKRIKPRSHR